METYRYLALTVAILVLNSLEVAINLVTVQSHPTVFTCKYRKRRRIKLISHSIGRNLIRVREQ